jgi:calcineurin-like phosphoesterase
MFRLLFIGDVVGETGCAAVRALVPDLRRELGLDAVVATGENSAPEGRGITADSGSALLSVVDFVTLGDHAFEAEGAVEYLDREPRVVRPANLDESRPGRGWGTFEAGDVRVGVANVQGRVFMQEDLRSPFEVADQAVADLEASGADLVLVDVHAEATSEKQAMGYHLEGRVQAVI